MALSRFFKLSLVLAAFLLLWSGCSKDDNKDSEAPVINLVSPVSGDRITDSLIMTATATDNAGVDRVEFYVQDSLLGIDATSPYSFSLDVSARADMTTLRVLVKAFDAEGNMASDTASVTIDRYSAGFTLTYSNVTAQGVKLTWTKFDGPFGAYIVRKSTTTGVNEGSTVVDTVFGASETTLTVGGLAPSSNHYFRVFALRTDSRSTATNEVHIVTDSLPSTPSDTTMIHIATTTFTRGDVWGSGDFDETPAARITVSGFYIDKYEVTCRQYALFMADSGYYREELWSTEGWTFRNDMTPFQPFLWDNATYNQPNLPVGGVSYYEAEAFANWAGKRLPTEAEWELAARGTGGTDHNSDTYTDGFRYPWSDDFHQDGGVFCNYLDSSPYSDGYEFSSPVGSFGNGNSSYELCDMSGNVAEWCSDWYANGYYLSSPTINPQGPATGSEKVIRGGSYIISLESSLATTSRDKKDPADQKKNIGFRCVRDE